ncbi:fatty acyl-AMP ligase [Streptomyces sp. SID8352]|uniref:fatty acyl-AMP ligase n=1 Tax=Streptomyces sp. SID8352 TaxID=2690338 RepID=UPI00136BC917|nr:fatty acyl-AMP ligase [Streptomyces sp. SID8352]MYU22517.1 AMP-binding protein [Streptomyces sp. SID8352]
MTAELTEHVTDGAHTLTGALALRGLTHPHDPAYVFLRDGEHPEPPLTYGDLAAATADRAGALTAAGLAGRPALLLYPTGPEFVRALLGCMRAGVVAAPLQVPTRARSLDRVRRVARDAGTRTVLTTAAVRTDLLERFGDGPELDGLDLIATDTLPARPAGTALPPPPGPDAPALLQYTSGSTGDPKGVVVSHANFLHNAAETRESWPCGPGSAVVSWLPLFHDMGMLFGVILPLLCGTPAYLMAPEAFIRRPARWLEAISRFRGTHAAAPSFAYELCARAAEAGAVPPGLDLSCWQVAANGAEPVRWHAIEAFTTAFAPHGFDARAMCPGFGLAENTLKATGDQGGKPPTVLWLDDDARRDGRVVTRPAAAPGTSPLVGCGRTVGGTRVLIVDPDTLVPSGEDTIGEIWVSGPCVAGGYHGRPALSEQVFRARPAPGHEDGRTYLRTGDLGFLHHGELFVNGRLKDVIVRTGRNYYPQDIELSAETSAPGLHPNCAAAFCVDDGTAERLVVVVEVDGRTARATAPARLRRLVRDAVWDNHRLETDDVLLVRRGSLPKTTSGKVQRRAARGLYEAGTLAAAGPGTP